MILNQLIISLKIYDKVRNFRNTDLLLLKSERYYLL